MVAVVDVDDRRTPDDELGPQLAAGRDATVHDAGLGRVLRRTTDARDLRAEAELMEHVRAAGYPVPQVFRVGPGELVLERVDGPTMLEDLVARPWRVRRHARDLAGLHADLHRIAAPSALPAHAVAGAMVLHQDLHPGNVILSPSGPVVIDWPNARRGAAEADVAQTWILMAAFDVDEPAPARGIAGVAQRLERAATPWLRRQLVATFLHASGCEDEARAVLPIVAEHRLTDPNVRPGEAAAIRALVAAESMG